MPVKNPHMLLRPIDPPRDHPPRHWCCDYCGAIGLFDDIRKTECSHVYPPCEVCGQTPECAKDCAGVLAVLGAPSVHVIGGDKPKIPDA